MILPNLKNFTIFRKSIFSTNSRYRIITTNSSRIKELFSLTTQQLKSKTSILVNSSAKKLETYKKK
jgi:hypothetical protein